MRARAFALLCALWLACARAAAYTVDCDHEYADCDELSKLADEEIQRPHPTPGAAHIFVTPEPQLPMRTTPKISQLTTTTITTTTTEAVSIDDPAKRPRLLNLSTEDLQSFANALHNQSAEIRNSMIDLSDVNLDEDEDEDEEHPNVPFSPVLASMVEKEEKEEKEEEICIVNGIIYKVGDKLDRACEETCECLAGGHLDCVPRCRHPYIRRGKRLEDPLCFLSPVDECCSIETCPDADGHGLQSKLEGCRYLNNTYAVAQKWYIGCEQACTCEKNNVVTCTPRCTKPTPSDKCINVQDPKDACCEVQVCDVSQDVHEIPENMTSTTTTTTTTTTEMAQRIEVSSEESTSNPKVPQSTRPLVLREPIGSVTVLQNNSVQVNLIHPNNSQDPIHLLLSSDGGRTFEGIQLKYTNLLLNLEGGKDYVLKTRETGTNFNFTITMTDDEKKNVSKIGCTQDEKFYEVGEEFRIGCIELCECTGNETRECAPLQCPNHVGLELVSRGCVLWARDPPPQPPECCPRTARCLSDGTCHYRGQSIPNWSEVPIALTGCEERCFCENGELDCQQVCSPLPALPPQSLRCPPLHRPVPVNISDEDCCKEWGCVPNVIDMNVAPPSRLPIDHGHTIASDVAVTPQPPLEMIFTTVLPPPTVATSDYQRPLTPPNPEINEHKIPLGYKNVSYESSEDLDDPFIFLHPRPFHPLASGWPFIEDTQPVNHEEIKSLISGHTKTQISQQSQLNQNTISYSLRNRLPNNNLGSAIKPAADKLMFSPTNWVPETTTIITTTTTTQPQLYPNPLTGSLFFPSNLNRAHKFHVPTKVFSKNLNAKCATVPCKQITVLRTKDILLRPSKVKLGHLEKDPSKARVIAKDPDHYDTVLQKLPDIDHETHLTHTTYGQRLKPNNDKYPMVNLNGILDQMDIGEGVNRNTGRSSGKGRNAWTAGATPIDGQTKPSHPHQPSFLPTLPPNNQFPHNDDDEISDYGENNIHHPLSPSEPNLPSIPNQPQLPPNYADVNKKLSVISLQADTPTSVKMLFGLPPVLVGLRGSVDLRYTDKSDDDFSRWSSQVFAPADEVLTTSRLEFRLTGLKPSTTYRVRGKLYLANLHVQPESDVYSVRTQDATVEEKRREIDSKLQVVDVNDTSAHVSWRHFNEDELQFIDGIQVRYRPVGTPIYIMTELLHHSRSNADLHDLRPGSKYEASLVLVPPPRTATELHDPASVEFTTSPYVDPYNWSVTIEANSIGSEACSLTWRGVPSPAERWVRVYRAAHACGSGRAREHDAFRLAARDQPPQITLSGLEPDTRCRVWLEMFLTNGKVKTSNVLEVNTKPLDTPEPIDNAIELSSIGGRGGENRGDYYGALVIVGVIAALGAVTSLLLLLIVVRRHRPRSVPITPVPSAPRDSSLPPYDNPAYKIELQQETMDL